MRAKYRGVYDVNTRSCRGVSTNPVVYSSRRRNNNGHCLWRVDGLNGVFFFRILVEAGEGRSFIFEVKYAPWRARHARPTYHPQRSRGVLFRFPRARTDDRVIIIAPVEHSTPPLPSHHNRRAPLNIVYGRNSDDIDDDEWSTRILIIKQPRYGPR